MRQIGKYHVQEQIGVGGFGEVFKGFDPYIKRPVAIKTCSTHNDEIRSRFFQEAEIAGNLNHKNITTIHDFGVEGELPYLVQEYLSGEDLDHKIKRRDPLPYAEKLVYLIQISRGLAHAHENGVIHRDIKPANVRILEDGTAKIMDFGIAKLAQQETGLTQTGMTLGTAAYLSPEQIRGQAVDARTDVFSFGVMAYELLTYRRPFDGTQISAVLYQLLHNEPPPMREVWPDAPAGAAAVVGRCLEKDPAKRYRDADEVLHALERLSASGRAVPPPAAVPSPSTGEPATPPGTQRAATLLDASPLERNQPASLEDIEISTTLVAAPDDKDIAAYASTKKRSPLPLIVAVALAALAGLGGWYFGTQGQAPDSTSEKSSELAADGSDSAAEDADGAVEDVKPPTPGDNSGAQKTAEDTGDQPEKVTITPGLAVIEPPSWTDQMTVRLGKGAARALDRRRSYELKPGRYQLTFEINQDGYQQSQTVPVSIGEAARQPVAVPIAEPGGISVRPQLNRPQGEVLIDGLPRGSSPLRRLMLPPGSYVVEVRPRGGGDSLRQQVELGGGTLAILTFDLEAGTMQRTDKSLFDS